MLFTVAPPYSLTAKKSIPKRMLLSSRVERLTEYAWLMALASGPRPSCLQRSRVLSLAGVEVQFASDTGVRYVIDSAAQTGDLSLQGGDNGGMVELTMSGNPAREVR